MELVNWDFSDGTFGPLTESHGTGTWTVVDLSGNDVGQGTTGGNSWRARLTSTDYGTPGAVLHAKALVRFPALGNYIAGIHIGGASSGFGGYQVIAYALNGSGNGAAFQIRESTSSSSNVASTVPVIASNTWYRLEADWTSGTGVVARIYEHASNTLLSTLSRNDASFTSGRAGLITYGDGNLFDEFVLSDDEEGNWNAGAEIDIAFGWRRKFEPDVTGISAVDLRRLAVNAESLGIVVGSGLVNLRDLRLGSSSSPGGGGAAGSVDAQRIVPVSFPFTYLRRYEDRVGHSQVFTPEQADLLEDRDQSLEKYLQEAMPDLMFSYPGGLAPTISPKYRARNTYRVDSWVVSLNVAGLSTSEIWVLVNGVRRVDLSMAAGVDEREVQQHILLTKGVDKVQVEIVSAGSEAADLNVQGLLRH